MDQVIWPVCPCGCSLPRDSCSISRDAHLPLLVNPVSPSSPFHPLMPANHQSFGSFRWFSALLLCYSLPPSPPQITPLLLNMSAVSVTVLSLTGESRSPVHYMREGETLRGGRGRVILFALEELNHRVSLYSEMDEKPLGVCTITSFSSKGSQHTFSSLHRCTVHL